MRGYAIGRWQRAVGLAIVFIIASTAENAVTQLGPDDGIGEVGTSFVGALNGTAVANGAVANAKTPKPLSALEADITAQKPEEILQSVEAKDVMSPKAARASARLAKQLSAMVDQDGKSVLSGDTKAPTESPTIAATKAASQNVTILPKAPASPKLVNAMMGGQQSQKIKGKGGLVPESKPKFRAIPFFKFLHLGQEQDGRTQKQCEEECASDAKCLSFSYSEQQQCIISKSAVQYDLEFNFYAKKNKKTEGASTFRHLGAMKYVYTDGETQAKAITGRSKENCEVTCGKDASCKSFTYRARDKLCLTSKQQLGYAQGWKYFEKEGAAEKVATETKYGKAVKGVSKKALLKVFSSKKGKAVLQPFSKVKANAVIKKASKAVKSPNHALTPAQLAYLAKKTDSKVHITQQEIMKNALKIRTHKLNEEQAARVAIAKMAAERAKKIAEYRKTKEVKGKNLYKTELRSSAASADGIVEKATKMGWTHRERKKKAAAKAREQSNKHTVEMTAKKIREKTRKKMQEKAQKELELTDAVKAAKNRVKIAVDDLASAKTANKASAKRIKFLVSEQQRATAQLAKAGDMVEEAKAVAKLKKAEASLASQKKVQEAMLNLIKKLNEKMPGLMKTEQEESINIKKFQDKEKQAKLAIKGASTQSKLAMDEAADAASKAGGAHSKAAMKDAVEKLKAGKVYVIKAHTKLSASRDISDKAATIKRQMDVKLKEIRAWRTATKADATVLLGSSKFQEKQEIGNEAAIKSTLGGKMKAIIVAKEKHKKRTVKLKEFRKRIKDLERAEKEQADERKVKRLQQSKEKSQKQESKVADKVKRAKTKEKEGAKMLNAAKLAEATAVTVGQKVKAAQAASKAETLKVSGEQKLASREPQQQKAKAQEAKNANKLSAEKNLMSSDETKLNKSIAQTDAAKEKVAKTKAKGPVSVIKAEEVVDVKLAAQSAKLVGANPHASVAAAMAKAAKLHKKAKAATAHVQELHKKYKARQALALQAKAEAHAEAKGSNDPKALASFIAHKQAEEAGIKQHIKHLVSGQHKAAAKEQRKREAASALEKRRKRSKKELSKKKFMDAEKKRQEKLRVTEDELRVKRSRASGSGYRGAIDCTTRVEGRKSDVAALQAQESCSKQNAKRELQQERKSKQDGRASERKLKQFEKAQKERKIKDKNKEVKRKRERRERDGKEKARKTAEKEKKSQTEKERKAKMKEEKAKETAKKTQEKNRKEKKRKEKEAKNTQEKDQKEKGKKETKAKASQKETKSKEKKTKEALGKKTRKEKASKETKEKATKGQEKATKAKEKKAKEEAMREKKSKEVKFKEKDSKDKEKKEKEKVQKEKTKKKEQKTKETTSKETSVKKRKEQKTKEATSKETSVKKTKESTTKEKVSKEQKVKSSKQEVTNKAKTKEQAAKVKAREVETKSNEVKQKTDTKSEEVRQKATAKKERVTKAASEAKQKTDAAAERRGKAAAAARL